mmetsp:Transcript_109741/g.194005  ORF Transcript_109741/g.194005 Transcript_109741/m.194005 type:complete len:167 (-) Transcript_109741:59-559(-)
MPKLQQPPAAMVRKKPCAQSAPVKHAKLSCQCTEAGCHAKVVNVRKAKLKARGFRDLEHWVSDPSHIYIGRNMTFYVKGAVKSKWHNPYSVKKYGSKGAIEMYRQRLLTGVDEKGRKNTLLSELGELAGKELGCWCHPEPCHGDVLADLLKTSALPTTEAPSCTRS